MGNRQKAIRRSDAICVMQIEGYEDDGRPVNIRLNPFADEGIGEVGQSHIKTDIFGAEGVRNNECICITEEQCRRSDSPD